MNITEEDKPNAVENKNNDSMPPIEEAAENLVICNETGDSVSAIEKSYVGANEKDATNTRKDEDDEIKMKNGNNAKRADGYNNNAEKADGYNNNNNVEQAYGNNNNNVKQADGHNNKVIKADDYSNNNVMQADGDNQKINEEQENDYDLVLHRFEIFKKEQKIQQLQMELENLKMQTNEKKENVLETKRRIETLKELIPMFDGGDQFKNWLLILKGVRDTYKVDENVLRALIYNKLKGKAKEWLFSNPGFMAEPVDKLLIEMGNMFQDRETKIDVRRKLENCVWRSGECFAKYYNEKLIFANGIDLPEDEFILYAIEGIPDVNLRNTAKLQNFSSKAKLKQAFKNVEQPMSSGQQRSRQTKKVDQQQGKDDVKPKRNVKCYNCNSIGHMANECRKPKREDGACFACAGMGHVAKDCQLYKKTPNTRNGNDYNVS
ncbi:hypothetical protein ACLKA6_001995 [Drosophila palustris]